MRSEDGGLVGKHTGQEAVIFLETTILFPSQPSQIRSVAGFGGFAIAFFSRDDSRGILAGGRL